MALYAQFGAVGQGLMLFCELALALPVGVIVATLMVSSPVRRRHPAYWIALVCEAQAVVAVLVSPRMGFGIWFDALWLVSMGLVLLGPIVLVVWTRLSGPAEPSAAPDRGLRSDFE
jgi:hypothetical protein